MPSFFMTVENTAWRDVYRPTMFREPKVPGNKGTEVIMVDAGGGSPPAPDPEPLTLVTAPTLTGEAVVGATINGTKAVYSGGVPPVEVQSQFQISDAASGSSWSGVDAWGTDSGGTHYISPDDVGKYFRVAGRAIDSSEDSVSKAETLMSFSELLGPVVSDREPITVTMAAKWSDLNNYKVGETVFADTAGFAGGLEETTTYRWRTQTRPEPNGTITNGSWTNYTDHAEEVSVVLELAGQIRFQCQARDTGVDPVEQINSFASWETVQGFDPLAVATPVATGQPTVGETLSCNEPEVTGGSDGPFQYGYYWVDETNAMIWERQYQHQEMVLTEDQIGKTYKCLVTVTDQGWAGGETVTVESNALGPVEAQQLSTTIGTVTIKVLDSLYDWENPTTLTVLMNDEIDIVTTISGDANPTYKYTVRDTDMEYEIKPPESTPNMGNGPDIIYIPKTPGLHTVSISISDNTATDDGASYPGVQLWAVDAKTWAELQAKAS